MQGEKTVKTAITTIFIVFVIVIYFGAEANAVSQSKNIIEGFNPSLMASGTFSMPKKTSSGNYDPSYGFLFSIGGITPSENKNTISSMSIIFSRDSFVFNEKAQSYNIVDGEKATISSIHVSSLGHLPVIISKNLLFLPYTGSSTGISKFSISDVVFDKLDQSTLTELKEENDRIQASNCWKTGAQVSLKDLIPGMKLLSVMYSYDLMTVEKTWMPWHSIINALIFGTVNGVFDAFGQISPNSSVLGLVVLTLKAGTTALWYNFDYKHHNWPFKDYEPLKYHRESISVSTAF
jgi:hypothetical protein